MRIVEFIEARLAEDEAIATAVGAMGMEWCAELNDDYDDDSKELPYQIGMSGGSVTHRFATDAWFEADRPPLYHAARHDPARVLREVAAKRALIEAIFSNASDVDGEWGDGHTPAEIRAGICADHGSRSAASFLNVMATVWSDHPDYPGEAGAM